MMSKLEDNVNEILGLEKKTEVAVKDFEQPAPVPKKIDETKRAGATNKHGVEAKKFTVNKSLGTGFFLKRNLN